MRGKGGEEAPSYPGGAGVLLEQWAWRGQGTLAHPPPGLLSQKQLFACCICISACAKSCPCETLRTEIAWRSQAQPLHRFAPAACFVSGSSLAHTYHKMAVAMRSSTGLRATAARRQMPLGLGRVSTVRVCAADTKKVDKGPS